MLFCSWLFIFSHLFSLAFSSFIFPCNLLYFSFYIHYNVSLSFSRSLCHHTSSIIASWRFIHFHIYLLTQQSTFNIWLQRLLVFPFFPFFSLFFFVKLLISTRVTVFEWWASLVFFSFHCLALFLFLLFILLFVHIISSLYFPFSGLFLLFSESFEFVFTFSSLYFPFFCYFLLFSESS